MTPSASPVGKSPGKVASRNTNERLIRDYLCSRAGNPPTTEFTCGVHKPIAYTMCTSQTDGSLTGAGFWYAACYRCKKSSWLPSLLSGKALLDSDEQFRTLIAIRESLRPTPKTPSSGTPKLRSARRNTVAPYQMHRPASNASGGAGALSLSSSPDLHVQGLGTHGSQSSVSVESTFTCNILICSNSARTTLNLPCPLSGFFRLYDHKLVLGECGIEVLGTVERYDRSSDSWLRTLWNEDLHIGRDAALFLRYTSGPGVTAQNILTVYSCEIIQHRT
ncbi:hypothetical protein NP233_g10725 [Leucocoprinus birnbaumii]|uniref:Uncharacterized protein n=1 Tax=Leucocoprinus birnbaumii TaxID=56174 RepID=A0AAD5VHQ4_9AGAR|nr:hypothetical protein NP233_g10725 [Leucocoprinus birnbaumii]